ncbi:SDR family oxidoreductase [Nonomuraea sp. MCN248]|uniref:SDR family oxidoreductase n=1 Tax=Nonomuraea corallina TaxID=2989783 RepID=A0ABT4S6Z3_9ACTN|nr:SDR family oxidoreductase [Nonomuraea corallina]MDA0632765.1 SDR family oxidoreductase [Nonomuraea corallina]
MDRIVIVTGGGSGIGRATAHAFARQGCGVLIVGRDAGALKETAAGHDGIHPLEADLTADGGPESVAEAAGRRFGRVDVLVNNAGAGAFGALGTLDRARIETQTATNLIAPILLTQAVLEPLAAAEGVVVNVSSAGALGLRSWPGNAVYGATKAGLDLLTRSWAVELGARGIRVVGIAPGVIDTDAGVRAGMPRADYTAFLDGMRSRVPVGRIGTPEEVAWWITQVTAPEAAYASGTVIAIDGALSVT